VRQFIGRVGLVSSNVCVVGGNEGKLSAEINASFRTLRGQLCTAGLFPTLEDKGVGAVSDTGGWISPETGGCSTQVGGTQPGEDSRVAGEEA